MDHKITIAEAIVGGFAGIMAYVAGLNWHLLIIWALIVFFDVLSGVLKGLELEWESRKFKSGLIKKAYELILVIAMLAMNDVMEIMNISIMDKTIDLGYYIIGAFIVTDLVSVYENGKALGYGFPTMIVHIIQFVKKFFDGMLAGSKDDDQE